MMQLAQPWDSSFDRARDRMRLLAAAAGALLALAALPHTAAAAQPADDPADRPTEARVTARDVEASNAKLRDAYGQLVVFWQEDFSRIGERFTAPRVVRYQLGVRTGCGVMRGGNASYCVRDNTIYFDEVFVAGQAKAAARSLGTDGDMTAVGIIAHEMGHAVAMQLGHVSRSTYQNERTADCLAGAFALRAQAAGSIEPGDLDEALFGMASAGDPTPELTGDRRVDQAIRVRAAVMGHGTEEQRVSNFRLGLERGAGACLTEFRGLSLGAS